MVKFLLWCILFILCWPVALVAIALYPLVWLILLPFRLAGIASAWSAGAGNRPDLTASTPDPRHLWLRVVTLPGACSQARFCQLDFETVILVAMVGRSWIKGQPVVGLGVRQALLEERRLRRCWS